MKQEITYQTMRPVPHTCQLLLASVNFEGPPGCGCARSGQAMSVTSLGSANRKPWKSNGSGYASGFCIIARTGVQAQSPTSSLVPLERVNGCNAERRVLTVHLMSEKKCES